MHKTFRLVAVLVFAVVLMAPSAAQAGQAPPPRPSQSGLPLLDVWLIDDDQSLRHADRCPDFQGVYTRTLEALGLTYQVFEVGDNESPGWMAIDFNQAYNYRMVVYFSGAAPLLGCGKALSYNADGLQGYLKDGGRMLITGQDIGYWDANRMPGAPSFDPATYFGASYVQDSLPYGDSPVLGTDGNLFAGQSYPLSPTLQTSVDEIRLAANAAADPAVILTLTDTSKSRAAHVGTRLSAEPNIERVQGGTRAPVWTPLAYRTAYLSFGAEGLADETQLLALLGRGLGFLHETVAADFEPHPAYVFAGLEVSFTVAATASTVISPAVIGLTNTVQWPYRWDASDGRGAVTTTGATLAVSYTAPGVKTVYAEVMDGFGHKAVTTTTIPVLPLAVSAVISPIGGAASASISPGPGVTLAVSFPAAAYYEPFSLTLGLDPSLSMSGTAGFSFVGYPFFVNAFTANGTPIYQFGKPFTLTIQYGQSDVAGLWEAGLKVYHWQEPDGPWQALDTSVDSSAHTVTVVIDHLSRYGVQGRPTVLNRTYLPVVLKGD